MLIMQDKSQILFGRLRLYTFEQVIFTCPVLFIKMFSGFMYQMQLCLGLGDCEACHASLA